MNLQKRSYTPCNIATVDFRNRSIETKSGRINFKNGSYIEKDDIGKPDWEYKLTPKSQLYSFGNNTVRIIYIWANHLSGSGEHDLMVGFVCSGNRIRRVLEEYSLGPSVISQKGNTLSITVWTEYRGAAPPGGKTTKVLEWTKGGFVQKSGR